MEAIAISVVAKITEYTVAPIGRQFGYLFCYNGNIKKLEREVAHLEAKRRVVEEKVSAADNNCQPIREDVRLWLSDVISEKDKADTILGDTQKVGKGCLNEWCLNLKSRYWVSRKAAKKSQDLGLLLTRGENYNEVAGTQPPLGKVIVRKTQGDGISEAAAPAPDQIGGSSSGGLDSRVSIMKDIMEAVKDDKIRMIGIWGMGGVGKTTTVIEVKRRAKLDKSMFDEVVMTTVSKEPEMKKIQEDIAELLHLELKEQNTSARAERLHSRLTQKQLNGKPKRILIILDDVWHKLNLEAVGIPYEDSDQNGCKIVLTSRHKNVCDQMKANKSIFIDVLLKQEAMSLFQERNGLTDLHWIAQAIVKECGGLPIAIAIIANFLVNKEAATWKYVLKQLQDSSLKGENAAVYKTLQVSYDFLEPKEIKDFFLLCFLFPEDFNIRIDDLVRYGMGLRFLKNIGNLQDARDEAHAHVETLINSSLLLSGEIEESVKMHDLVRDFALYMTSEGEHVFLVKFGDGLKVWPINDTYEYFTSISLRCDKMDELPVGLKLPNLKILQLDCFSYRHSLQFPEEFYQGMGKLQVLVLRNMSILSLPGSLQQLTNLRTLSLHRCELRENISMIGYLKKLEILSFVESGIEELPGEIRELSRLRLLDLTDCRDLRRIPPSVLSSLTLLEELYMRGTDSFLWAEEEEEEEEESNATNASFAELKKLTNLEKFDLSVGKMFYSGTPFSVFQNNLYFKVDKSVVLEGIMNALCMRTENLHLQVKDLKNLPERVGFFELKRLIVQYCDELVFIVNTMALQSFITSSSFTRQPAPFGNLREIYFYKCNKLKNIFSLSIARGLSKLQSLVIWDCQMMEEIFSNSDDKAVGKNIEFPDLKELRLDDLPNLVGFCKAVEKVEFPQLERLELRNIPKLTGLYHNAVETESVVSEPHNANASPKHPLFNQKVTLNNLEELYVSEMENLIEIWPSQFSDDSISKLRHMKVSNCGRLMSVFPSNIIQGMQNLEFLKVEDCDRLENIFSLSIARGLVRVQSVYIRNCQTMEAIIFKKRGEEDENGAKIEFPNLNRLELTDLPNLVGLSKSVDEVELELPLLKELYLYNLPKLAGRFFNAKVTLNNLEELTISKMKNLIDIWPSQFSDDSISKLRHMKVSNCGRLMSVFPSNSIQGIQDLEILEVWDCDRLENIFSLSIARGLVRVQSVNIKRCQTMEAIIFKERGAEDENGAKIEFPNLNMLHLTDLPNLVGLCKSVDEVELELPLLKELHLRGLPKLAVLYPAKVTLNNLEVLEVSQMENLIEIWPSQFSDDSISKLRHMKVSNCGRLMSVFPSNSIQGIQDLEILEVWDCDRLENIFSLSIARGLVRVQNVNIKRCQTMEAIIFKERGEEDENGAKIEFPNLNMLHLTDLPNLVGLCKSVDEVELELPLLKELHLRGLPKLAVLYPAKVKMSNLEVLTLILTENLIEIWPAQFPDDSFSKLRVMKVDSCERLLSVFPSNIIQGLQNLQFLAVENCQMMEEIVSKDENDAKIEVKLPQLKRLTLVSLPNLVGFCKSVDEVKLPQLKELTLNGLPKLETKTLDSEHHLKVPLTNLAELAIKKMDHLTTIFPATEMQQLQNLGTLSVRVCTSVEVIFDFQGLNINESRPLCQLKELIISELPKLTHVWKKGPHVIQGFQNLTTLRVESCYRLKHLFTPSVAKILVGLEELKISCCMRFEAIVVKEEEGGEEKEEEEILFPQLTRLYLYNLPNLLAIAPKPYTLNLSSLRVLRADYCGKGAEPLHDKLLADRRATRNL